jgi:hypothetical protein
MDVCINTGGQCHKEKAIKGSALTGSVPMEGNLN